MSMDPAALLPLLNHLGTPRRIECVQVSRTVTATGAGRAVLRCMGAGGGGARGTSGRGGNGGTVATKEIAVARGDQFVITIPQGGAGRTGTDGPGGGGGTLTITRGGITLISIPGGLGGLNVNTAPLDNTAPTGADWFVSGGLAGNFGFSGGGGAMIVEGGTVAGKGGSGGGGGALGDGAFAGGGAIRSAAGNVGGTGYLTPETCVLRIAYPSPVSGYMAGTTFVPGTGAFDGGSHNSASVLGNSGGFGGGGARSGGANSQSGHGGFAGGGGGGSGSVAAGSGGPGGGGGGSSGGTGGNGGQGWVTIEWIGGAA